MKDHKSNLEERLNAHPGLRKRIEQLLKIVEDKSDDYSSADDAEETIINELQQLGNELMHDWATQKETLKSDSYRKKHTGDRHGKKK